MIFEEYLQEEHMEKYVGSKDNALEAFNNWLQDLEIEDWLSYGEAYSIKKALNSIKIIEQSIIDIDRRAKCTSNSKI